MIINSGFNFQNIRAIIDAASHLQDAGKDDDARKVMVDLAKDIQEAVQ